MKRKRTPTKVETDDKDDDSDESDAFEVKALYKDPNSISEKIGLSVKYKEPPDAAVPEQKWRFYVFKDNEVKHVLHLHRNSYYIFGRDQRLGNEFPLIKIDHLSCSKQHAILQFRRKKITNDDTGDTSLIIKPYMIDLKSSNGTFINGEKMKEERYYELLEKDVVKFGLSTRDYVLLHDKSKT